MLEGLDDWTVSDGCCNSSVEYLNAVQLVEECIRESAAALINCGVNNVARLIVSQLAYKLHFAPMQKDRLRLQLDRLLTELNTRTDEGIALEQRAMEAEAQLAVLRKTKQEASIQVNAFVNGVRGGGLSIGFDTVDEMWEFIRKIRDLK